MPTMPPKGTAESRRSPRVQPQSTTGNDLGNAAVSWRAPWRFGSASGPQFGQKLVRLLLFNRVGVCLHLAEGFVRQRPFGSCREQVEDKGTNRHQFGQQNRVGNRSLSGAQSGEYRFAYPGGNAHALAGGSSLDFGKLGLGQPGAGLFDAVILGFPRGGNGWRNQRSRLWVGSNHSGIDPGEDLGLHFL